MRTSRAERWQQGIAAEKREREEKRIRADLDALIERVQDSEMPDRADALGHLGQARNWLLPRTGKS